MDGFTLMELVVVMGIMAGLLVFSFPLFRSAGTNLGGSNQLHEVVTLIQGLRLKAVEQEIDYTLHFDREAQQLFFTDETETIETEARDKTSYAHGKFEKNVLSLNSGLEILDVEFPGLVCENTNEYRIVFRKQGYSDFALVHLRKNGREITLKIEPFLSVPILLDRYVTLENCI